MIYLIFRMMAFFLVLAIPVSRSYGQTGPLKYKSPFQIHQCDTIHLETTSYVPDSSFVSFSKLQFRLRGQTDSSDLFIAISNSGSILAFRDSSLQTPVLLEKRSIFPFERMKGGRQFMLICTKSPGPGDYLGFRLQENPAQGKVLDEVVLCSQRTGVTIKFMGCRGWLKSF